MITDYVKVALHNSRQRKVRSWLTMLGIFIGIAAIVALLSLSQGLRVAIEEQFASLGSDKMIVQAAGGGLGPPGAGVSEPLTKGDEKIIEAVQGVNIAVGRLIRTVKVQKNSEIHYAFAVSMPKEQKEKELVLEANNYKIAQGTFFERDTANEVVIGADVAKDLFDKELFLRDKILIQGEPFKITGILKKAGNPQQDDSFVIPEGSLRRILNLGDEYNVIPVQIEPGENIDIMQERIFKELRKFRNVEEGKENFIVETPQKIASTLDNILLILQGVLVGIATISLIIGAIGIMNTMYTSVIERTKEIGILKAVGARRKDILFIFLFESGFLGLMGGIIGIALGLAISKTVEFIAFQMFQSPLLQAQISSNLIISMLLFAFILGALSGTLPALQASKLKPVEALRQ